MPAKLPCKNLIDSRTVLTIPLNVHHRRIFSNSDTDKNECKEDEALLNTEITPSSCRTSGTEAEDFTLPEKESENCSNLAPNNEKLPVSCEILRETPKLEDLENSEVKKEDKKSLFEGFNEKRVTLKKNIEDYKMRTQEFELMELIKHPKKLKNELGIYIRSRFYYLSTQHYNQTTIAELEERETSCVEKAQQVAELSSSVHQETLGLSK